MAPAIAAMLTVLLLLAALVFAGHVESEHLGGSQAQGQEPPPVAGGALPNSQCAETQARLYRGPCVEMLCAAACLVQMRHGGHCRGNLIKGRCYCLSCS